MKKINVIVYNAKMQLFTKEEITKLDDYYKFLECDMFAVVMPSENISLYVDDEGLLQSGNLISQIKYKNFETKLAGNIIITGGVDDEGETLSCELSLIEVSNMISLTEYVVK